MPRTLRILLLTVFLATAWSPAPLCALARQDTLRFDSAGAKWEKHLFYKALDAYENNRFDQAMLILNMLKNANDDQSAYYALEAKIFEKINYPLGAFYAWFKANNCEPENWDYAKKVILYTAQKNGEISKDIVETSVKAHPGNPDVWKTAGDYYSLMGEKNPAFYKKALDAYNHLEQLQGVSEYSTLGKAKIYSDTNKKKKVIETINKLINDNPDNDRYKVMLGDFYLHHGKTDEAYRIFMDVQQRYPNNPYTYISLARYYQLKGESDKGRQCLYNAIENHKLDYDTKISIMLELSDRMTNSSANLIQFEKMLSMLREQYPYEEVIIGSQYRLYISQHRTAEAYAAATDLLDINPKSAQTWQSLIELTTDMEKKLELTNQAIAAVDSTDRMPFIFYRALWHMSKSEFAEAGADLDLCAKSAQQDHDNEMLVTVYQLKGDVCFNTMQYDEAIINYEKSIRLAPNHAMSLNNYAYLLVERDSTGDLRRAERMSAKAIELEPDNLAFIDTYAWIMYKQGSYRLADFYMTRLFNLCADQPADADSDRTYLEHAIEIFTASGNDKMLQYARQKMMNLNN